MRIAIISPYSTGTMRGNITTVRRIAASLGEAGMDVALFPMDVFGSEELERALIAFSPDIIHAFHAGYCGETACRLAALLKIPCVLTITGSDVGEPAFRESPATIRALAAAAAVVCFDDAAAALVAGHFPGSADRLVLIPQGVESLPAGRCPELPENGFVLLLPAALRPVKNIEFAISGVSSLCGEIGGLRLVIAGGVIDEGYADGIRALLAGSPCASWLGEVPRERMGALYARADLVLNCSHFEGMSNSLLEAMALGRAVLAADIPANRSLVAHGRTGWLYRDGADFSAAVRLLASDAGLRGQLGAGAREFVREKFSRRLEAERYIALYHRFDGDLP